MKRSKTRNPVELHHLRRTLEGLRVERNLLPAELAAKAVVPLSAVTRILNGQVTNPGVDLVVSLAKALGVTTSELLGDSPGTPTETGVAGGGSLTATP